MKLSKLFFLILTSAVLVACGGGGGDDEDDSNNSGPSASLCRILGGNSCDDGGTPVAKLDLLIGDSGARCSGTLVTPTQVLTAAHCILGGVDAINARVGGEDFSVVSIGYHPDYTGTASFDVALLTLDRSSGVTPVPLLASVPVVAGDELRIYGFGVKDDGEVSEALRTATVFAASANSLEISTVFDGTDSCPGDSGGPITKTVNGVEAVVGVVSLGVATSDDANPLFCGEGWVGFYSSIQDSSVRDLLAANAPGITIN